MTTRLRISPAEPTLDDVLLLTLTGPVEDPLLEARMVDPEGMTWTSTGPYPEQDPDPVVAMRWLWSMIPDPEVAPVEPSGPMSPTTVELKVRSSRRIVASGRVQRHRIPPGINRVELDEPGVVGVFYHPEEPSPGVVLLGGSEGGIQEVHAALLARHGYAVLALGYYGLPGLPPVMTRIPVETFARGADWLLDHPAVTGDLVGVVGGSKGGEAALLAAALFPQFGAVVSIAGSGIITNGINQSIADGNFLDIVATATPCFTQDGEGLPFLRNVVSDDLRAAIAKGEPFALQRVFQPALKLQDELDEATIPVERIAGPVLLVSSTDDTGYGPEYHQIAADRLVSHGKQVEHVINQGAGHGIIAPPWSPTTLRQMPGPGVAFLTGGSDRADAEARWHTWQRIIDFLKSTLS